MKTPFSTAFRDGREVPDPTPVSVPFDTRARTLQERIRACIRAELSGQAVDSGAESFEEADDFDTAEDDSEVFEAAAKGYEVAEMGPELVEGKPDVDAAPPPDPKTPRQAQKEAQGDVLSPSLSPDEVQRFRELLGALKGSDTGKPVDSAENA